MDFNLDHLVETITKEILKRINIGPKTVLKLDGCPSDIVSGNYEVTNDQGSGYGYVIMTAEAYNTLICGKPSAACEAPVQMPSQSACEICQDDESAVNSTVIDLSNKRLIHERDMRESNARCGDVIKVSKRSIITALARDYAKSTNIKFITG